MFFRFLSVLGGESVVCVRDVCVVAGLLVVSCIVVFRRFAVVLRRLLVVFGGLAVVMRARVLRHSDPRNQSEAVWDGVTRRPVPRAHGGWHYPKPNEAGRKLGVAGLRARPGAYRSDVVVRWAPRA